MNKIKTLIIICFFIMTFSIYKVNANVLDLSLLGRIIYLDAGHGGKDCGAISNNIYEKDINLILVKKLEKELVKKGAIVYLTRDGDYDLANKNVKHRKRSDLSNRAKLINNSDSDIYLSIHLNSTTNSTWRGIQIYYDDNNKNNLILAKTLNKEFEYFSKLTRKIKKENNYYMYKQIKKTGILIEAGFISNPNDNYLLRDNNYQDKLVNVIVKGVENYFS